MGWFITQGQTNAQLIQHLTEGDPNLRTHRKCVRGNTLWTIQENLKYPEFGRFIVAYRMVRDPSYGWGYKPVEESMGPADLSCPMSYLDEVPVPDSRFAALWRERVRGVNTSVRQNLLLAAPHTSEAMLVEALQQADMHDAVMALPKALDTVVGETGVRLSGGQARRLAIARALLKSAPILVLDELTERLDALSEQAVLQALDRLMRDRTTLLITHRPQVLHHADEVAVMRQGRVIEQGDIYRMMQESRKHPGIAA